MFGEATRQDFWLCPDLSCLREKIKDRSTRVTRNDTEIIFVILGFVLFRVSAWIVLFTWRHERTK
jgi:hypothetical protein